MAKFRVGVLTGGGDTSALNATIKGIARATEELDGELIGFRRGWAGVLLPDKEYFVEEEMEGKIERKKLEDATGEYVFLKANNINSWQGGSIILSSRTDITKIPGALEDVAKRLKQLNIDYFLPIGGDDTTTVTLKFAKENILGNIRIMAVPKTIDNDNGKIGPNGIFSRFEDMVNIWTPGFPTAVKNGTIYASFSYSTAYTHERVLWDEAMGRKPGWLALAMGYLGLADMTIIPEDKIQIEDICRRTLEIYQRKGFFYGVIAEGAIDAETGEFLSENKSIKDKFGHTKLGGAAKVIADKTKEYFKKKGVYAPYFNGQVPEYLYRGGTPTALDRKTAMDLGRHALESLAGNSAANGHMAVLLWDGKEEEKVVPSNMPLEKAVAISEKGKIIPRRVPVDTKNPENGFYDPNTKNITDLGKQYVLMFADASVQFEPWKGEIYK